MPPHSSISSRACLGPQEYATPQLHLLLRDSLVRTEDHAGGDGRRKPGRAVFPQGLAIFLVFEKEDQHQIFRNI